MDSTRESVGGSGVLPAAVGLAVAMCLPAPALGRMTDPDRAGDQRGRP